jgi:hypothetical protein
MSTDYAAVLVANYPGTIWTLDGTAYEGLTWLDNSPKPTQAELDAAWPQIDYANQCTAVESARLLAYEQTSDPIFFKWQRGDGTQEEWLAAVAKVKADNPYPLAP